MRKRLLCLLLLALAGCGARTAVISPTATLPPTATVPPPTTTMLPPTATVLPPTATALPPTATALPPTAAARAAPSGAVRLVIPELGLDRVLDSVGLDRDRVPVVPKHEIGWYNLSASPGQGENVVLWGHVLRFKATPKIPAPFARLKELVVGSPLTLYSGDGVAHKYLVIEQVWATPDQVAYILPKGRELVTLVSCIGDKVVVGAGVEMTHRLITIAAPASQ